MFPLVLAQAAPSMFDPKQLLFFGGLFAIMYFVLIRPQQKQQKEQQTMLAGLKKGDDVVTASGILGKVFAVADKTVTLEIAPGTKIRVLKSTIQSRGSVSDDAPKADEAKDAKKEEK
jgi:preprotein translocase subunit YajC